MARRAAITKARVRARGEVPWIPGIAWRNADVRIAACEEVFGLQAGIRRIRYTSPEMAKLRAILAARPAAGTA